MNTATAFFLVSDLALMLFAITFLLQKEYLRKKLIKQRQKILHQDFELSILNKAQQDIYNIFNLKDVLHSIVLRLEDLFEASTVSYAIISNNKIDIKTFTQEDVGIEFTRQVKEALLKAIFILDRNAMKSLVYENVSEGAGNRRKKENNQHIQKLNIHLSKKGIPDLALENKLYFLNSYFNIPLFIGDKLVGLINISSKNKDQYTEEDMTVLYKTISRLGQAIAKVNNLVKSEKGKLESMLLSIPVGAIKLLFEDNGLKFTYMNSAARNFLNLDKKATTIHIISSFGKSIDLIKELKNVLNTKKDVVLNNVLVNEKFFKVILSPIFEEESITGISVTMEDVTFEKHLQVIHDNFTNMVVHELRAPLVSIKGAAQLLSSSTLNKDDTEKMLKILQDSVNAMLDEIGQLLDAAKIDAGGFMIIKDIANINEVVKEKIDAFNYLAKERNITIDTSLENAIPEFEFDRVRMGQVVNNLLSNSLKFTNTGGKIEVDTRKNDGSVTVTVKDNGIGIPQEQQSSLFTRYAQASGVFRKDSTGLGLYISKGIVKSHGGRIWLESVEGKGTTVSFTIPILNTAAAEKEKHHQIISASNVVVN